LIELFDHQKQALTKMKNGCILCGGVGSGKSRTALAYYYIQEGGSLETGINPSRLPTRDIYIITTARKRDTNEWEVDMRPFGLSSDDGKNELWNHVTVDSWNNIGKYTDVKDCFFIFDEQRVVGYGAWTKAFLKIVKNNQWILLSATPGDCWMDYLPVFIANGYFKNKTDFTQKHVQWAYHSTFPRVERYLNQGILVKMRNSILVNMDFQRKAIKHHKQVFVDYDILAYKTVMRDRWNAMKNKPIENASEYCYVLRQIVNSSQCRVDAVYRIVQEKRKCIIFYNFDYELELLKSIDYGDAFAIAEWNGHKHEKIPDGDNWVYLVQYTAGAEGWNCITTDTIIFYSQNYSYKVMVQSQGRIDRLNTPFTDLYYYHLKTKSSIDLAIARALNSKKSFNERGFSG